MWVDNDDVWPLSQALTISKSGFKAGMEVAIASRRGHVDLDPAGIPDKGLVEFTARFTERYREDLAELADL
jgi:hypothetical protein